MPIQTDLSALRTRPISRPTRKRPKNIECCELCHRPLRLDGETIFVRVVDGGNAVIHREDSANYIGAPDDHGFEPIGPECARKLGGEYTWTCAEGEWFIDRANGRPITLGPISPMEEAWMRFTPWQREQVLAAVASGQDLPYGWGRHASTP